jgi:hypothetical protein
MKGRGRRPRACGLILAGLLASLAKADQEAGEYFRIDHPASIAPHELGVGVTHRLWIPDGAVRLRAIIFHQHGAGIEAAEAGASAPYDLHWQALARKWNCGLHGPEGHQEDIEGGHQGQPILIGTSGTAYVPTGTAYFDRGHIRDCLC